PDHRGRRRAYDSADLRFGIPEGLGVRGEYGDWPKVVMAFDGMKLKRTFREIVISEVTADEIEQLMNDYPTCIKDDAGERLWLTRFAATDPRAASPYEYGFARWIPDNPFDALLAVFVFMPEE
ncbi:MAG: hypothetical protein ACRDN0_05935, partial [Trebonia sp.]